MPPISPEASFKTKPPTSTTLGFGAASAPGPLDAGSWALAGSFGLRGRPQLEPSARRFYCGTLGVETAEGFCAALLTRTATRVDEGWEYGVGSGVTWDSVPAAELAEVRLNLGAL
jgi:hypothetical protein